MRILFAGTPEFAVPALETLLRSGHEVCAVYTQPDRPAGRGRKLTASPVKLLAAQHGLPVLQPAGLKEPAEQGRIRDLAPDLMVVVAYGLILPTAILDIPKRGCINIHASLLPRWRGAAPIQAVIRAGDAETGITIMKMDAGLDTGAMLSQRAIPIAPDETGQSLHDKLCVLGGELLIETLPGYLSGAIQPIPQDDALATFAPRIEKDEGRIDWTQSAAQIERTIRAFTPWPGTFTRWDGKGLKIHAGTPGEGSADPGKVIERGGQIAVGTGSGVFYPTRVQLEGRGVVSITDFVRGYPAFVGATLSAS